MTVGTSVLCSIFNSGFNVCNQYELKSSCVVMVTEGSNTIDDNHGGASSLGMFSLPDVPAFIAKLWHMVVDQSTDDLIRWGSDGTSFIITDHTRFASELLPMYYKHNNMASFIRQLNMYGFHKIVAIDSASLKNDRSDLEFYHPNFKANEPILLTRIKRKLPTHSKEVLDRPLASRLLQEVQQLQMKQESFDNKLSSMKVENDALWREYSILRQKHVNQQKIVNKLIHFLITLVNQVNQARGLNMKRRNAPFMIKDVEPNSSKGSMICALGANDSLRNIGNQLNDNGRRLLPITCSGEYSGDLVTSDSPTVILCDPEATDVKRDIDIEGPPIAVPIKEVCPAVIPVGRTASIGKSKPRKRNHDGQLITWLPPQTTESNSKRAKVSSKPLPSPGPSNEETVPIITSPSSTPSPASGADTSNSKQVSDLSLVLSGQSGSQRKLQREDVDCHLDMVQSDLDVLKEILQGEGLSVDANTLLGLFSADDPISLNFPPLFEGEEGERIKGIEPGTILGNEVATYTPNLVDMVDITEDTIPLDEFSNSPADISALNTPQDLLATLDFPNPRSKKLQNTPVEKEKTI